MSREWRSCGEGSESGIEAGSGFLFTAILTTGLSVAHAGSMVGRRQHGRYGLLHRCACGTVVHCSLSHSIVHAFDATFFSTHLQALTRSLCPLRFSGAASCWRSRLLCGVVTMTSRYNAAESLQAAGTHSSCGLCYSLLPHALSREPFGSVARGRRDGGRVFCL